MRIVRGFAGVITLLILCACSTIKPMQPTDARSVASINLALEKRADEYQAASANWGGTEAWNNIPLIALGAGGVAASAFASGVAKGNWAIGLALAAGAWALGYSTLAPNTKQDAYSTAAAQLLCLADKSKRAADDRQKEGLVTSVNALTNRTNFANAARAQVPSTLSADNDKNALIEADALVANAKGVLDAANAELDARGSIPLRLKSLLYAIDRRAQLAARSKVMTIADVSGPLISAIGGMPAAGGAPSTTPTGGSREPKSVPATNVENLKAYVDAANQASTAAKEVADNSVVKEKTYTSALASFPQCTSDR